MQFNMKQALHSGDLCVVDGYGNRVWEVIGYTFEKSYVEGDFYEEIIYNLACIMTSEWTIGIQEDTQLVCRAKYAIEYVRELNGQGLPPSPESHGYVSPQWSKVGTAMKNTPIIKNGKESFVYPDTNDGLLMQLSDFNCLREEMERSKEDTSTLDENINKVKELLKSKNPI